MRRHPHIATVVYLDPDGVLGDGLRELIVVLEKLAQLHAHVRFPGGDTVCGLQIGDRSLLFMTPGVQGGAHHQRLQVVRIELHRVIEVGHREIGLPVPKVGHAALVEVVGLARSELAGAREVGDGVREIVTRGERRATPAEGGGIVRLLGGLRSR